MLKALKKALAEADNSAIATALKSGEFVRKIPRKAIKAVDAETHTIDFVISSDEVDRDSERILPKAFQKHIDTYMDNPVILYGHNPHEPAVGRLIEPKFTDEEFTAGIQFAVDENPFAETLWKLYSADFMRAVSVGFIPRDWTDDKEHKLDGQRGKTYTEVELLEVSLVPVPSNRATLSKMYSDLKSYLDPTTLKLLEEISDPFCVDGDDLPTLKTKDIAKDKKTGRLFVIGRTEDGELGWVESDTHPCGSGGVRDAPRVLPHDDNSDNKGDVKRVTRFANLPKANEDTRWRWNTSAQNAVLGDDDWSRYKKAHIWHDPENDEAKSGYKLPVAKMIGDELKVVWRGVASAMGALLGARGGVDIPDDERRPAYNHLKRYYDAFDREPPEFRDYTDAELRDLEDEGQIVTRSYEGAVMLGREFTAVGSWERDQRDIKRAVNTMKREWLESMGFTIDDDGYYPSSMIVLTATYDDFVVCYCNPTDEFYRVNWSRNTDGEIDLSELMLIEIDFANIEGVPLGTRSGNPEHSGSGGVRDAPRVLPPPLDDSPQTEKADLSNLVNLLDDLQASVV